jgi:hypothetical protein
MHGKPLRSRSSERLVQYRGSPPLHAIKKISRFLKTDEPVPAVRARPQHKVVAFQSIKSLIDRVSAQIRDVGSVKDDLLSALSKSSKKSHLHSLAQISGTLL